MPDCKKCHNPSKETVQVLKDTDEGKNLIEHDTIEEFWETLGFNNHSKPPKGII